MCKNLKMYYDEVEMKYANLTKTGALIFVADKDPKSNENLYLKFKKTGRAYKKIGDRK